MVGLIRIAIHGLLVADQIGQNSAVSGSATIATYQPCYQFFVHRLFLCSSRAALYSGLESISEEEQLSRLLALSAREALGSPSFDDIPLVADHRRPSPPSPPRQETSVADPAPPDPHVFGPPGSESGSISHRYGLGSGSFCCSANLVRKTLIFILL